jgi:membrane-bound lytic murein transglycosylase B
MRQLNEDDQQPLANFFLSGGTFSDILRLREATQTLHDRMTGLLLATRDARTAREHRQKDLTQRREELLDLQKLQQAQRVSLQREERRKQQLLSQNISQQRHVASEIAEAEEARAEIQQAIFTLRNVGLRLSLKEAEDFARYAGKLTGVRPALLLGVLKVESNLGTNVGSGRYPDDMHPAHREAFLRVAEKLGLDPTTTPVSARPRSYPGWGGALGPGQIMPGTWERIEETVARLTGKPKPSPFDLGDAFVATAVILGGAGAANGNEYEAVNRYFAGPNWQRFTWYGDRVLAVAKEYEGRGP